MNMEPHDHRSPSPTAFLFALRPRQWTKNAVVLAAFFFAFWDRSQPVKLGVEQLITALAAAACFCIVSSGIYVFNDIRDIENDRRHPLKKQRPIASGAVRVPIAWLLAAGLLSAGLMAALALQDRFAMVVAGYVALQVVYSLWLKQVALVDINVIAAGFVLRAISGAVVLGVEISPWLLLCTFLLALFLGLCKRRNEKVLIPAENNGSRPSLGQYDERLLDQLIAIVAAATVISYAIYTLWPKTVEKFGTSSLGFSIPFVIFGIFRYLDLVYRHRKGDRPEMILLTDGPLMADIALYGLCMLAIFKFHV